MVGPCLVGTTYAAALFCTFGTDLATYTMSGGLFLVGLVCLQVLLAGNRITMGCACESMRGFDNPSFAKRQIESAGAPPKIPV